MNKWRARFFVFLVLVGGLFLVPNTGSAFAARLYVCSAIALVIVVL